MHHLIIGYGYCGFYLAKYLISKGQKVTAISRHLDEAYDLPGLTHIKHNIYSPINLNTKNTIVYYLIPPPSEGLEDSCLRNFLQINAIDPVKMIYFGSSAVYGDHKGAWVDETSPCKLDTPRQYRRLDAEVQCLNYCKGKAIDCVILRIAGIYGPKRLPIDGAMHQLAIINPENAPYTNLIYVKDLARIAALLAMNTEAKGLYNLADGHPQAMGALQQQVAKTLDLPKAATQSFTDAWEGASAMKREFMQASKRLSIKALQTTLMESCAMTPLEKAVAISLKEKGQ